MSTQITTTELEDIRNISSLILSLYTEYGEKSYEVNKYKDKVAELEEEEKQIHLTLRAAQKSNDELIETLRTKYGDVIINLETGQIS